uniref:Snf7-domain-containing protein n=1 Tax=Panagrellus redivivus TaxID=6233 RepID=A0A7E4W3V4_PANRE
MFQWVSNIYSYLFGPSNVPTPQNTIDNLRNVEETLLKKQTFLEENIKTEASNARKLATTNKRAAIQALRKKKQFEAELATNDGVLANIQNQLLTLENTLANAEIVDTMKNVKNALKDVHKTQDADNVHDLIDDIAEQQELAEEISGAISSPNQSDVYNQSELDDELAELQAEVQSAEMAAIGPIPSGDIGDKPHTDSVKTDNAEPRKQQIAA